jgi:hypothetical protein
MAQAGHRCRPVHGFDLHGAPARSAIADLENLPLQPYGTSIDLFMVPTIAFQQLFAFLVLSHERRRLLWFAVTRNPTAEWLARQITEDEVRTHVSLGRDAPFTRSIERYGDIVAYPILGGLQDRYARI